MPLWSILLLIFLTILSGLVIFCYIFCWIRNSFKRLLTYQKKNDSAESLVSIKPIPITTSLYTEQVDR